CLAPLDCSPTVPSISAGAPKCKPSPSIGSVSRGWPAASSPCSTATPAWASRRWPWTSSPASPPPGLSRVPTTPSRHASRRRLRFALASSGACSRVEWRGGCDLTADELVQPKVIESGRQRAVEAAADFLESALEAGARPWEELVAEAAQEG